MLVYDNDGVAHEKHPPDARECVEVLGWSLTPPEVSAPAEKPAAKPKKAPAAPAEKPAE